MSSAVFLVLSAWAGLFGVAWGWGHLASRCMRGKEARTLFPTFWFGLALMIGVLQGWHLFFAVDWRAGAAIGVVGMGGCIAGRKRGGAWRCSLSTLAISMASLVGLLWIAGKSVGAPLNFDSGLYHFNSIRWLNEHPIVPGLANLHGRLGFNQSYFLLVAMLNVSPFFHQGFHLANGFLVGALGVQLLLGTFRLLRIPHRCHALLIFQALALPVVGTLALTPNISSPTPDVAIFVLGLVATLQFIEFLARSSFSRGRDAFDLASLFFLGMLGITMKLSFAAFGGSVMFIAWIFGLMRGRASKATRYFGMAFALILLPWLIRGLIASGYAAFPSAWGSAPMDWRVPREAAVFEAERIVGYARKPGLSQEHALENGEWFAPWLAATARNYDVLFPLGMGGIGLGILAIAGCFGKKRISPVLFLPLIPCFLWVIFCFTWAPDPRFAGASFWILGLWIAALALGRLAETKPGWVARSVGGMALTLFFVQMAASPAGEPDPSDFLGFAPIPKAMMKPVRTDSGLILYVPDSATLQSWDSLLPSTPYPNPSLELRGADLSEGFRIQKAGDGR